MPRDLTNDQILAKCAEAIRAADAEVADLRKQIVAVEREKELHSRVAKAVAPVSGDALTDLVNVRRAGAAIGNYGSDSPMARALANSTREQERVAKRMQTERAALAKASEAPAPAPTRAQIIAEQARQRDAAGKARWS